MRHIRPSAGIAAVLAAVLAGPASADAVADFYKGKTVRLVSGGSAGGGFSTVARVLGATWQKHIPGNPTIIVDAMAGAGGAKMMSYMANAPLLCRVKFNAADFQWLGSVTPMTEVSTVWHIAPARTIEEAKTVEVIMATSSKLSSAYLIPAFMNAVAGTRFKIVPGYRGAGPMNKAMETGEVHGRGSFYNSYVTTKRDWLDSGKIIQLVQADPAFPS